MPIKTKANRAAYMKKRRETKCNECAAPQTGGGLCNRHREAHRLRQQQRRAKSAPSGES